MINICLLCVFPVAHGKDHLETHGKRRPRGSTCAPWRTCRASPGKTTSFSCGAGTVGSSGCQALAAQQPTQPEQVCHGGGRSRRDRRAGDRHGGGRGD